MIFPFISGWIFRRTINHRQIFRGCFPPLHFQQQSLWFGPTSEACFFKKGDNSPEI